MPLVPRAISNLFGGVSQQAAGVRLDNQCEELLNAYPSIADGLVKRPPSEFVALIDSAGEGSESMFHTINRDGDEKYIVIFTGNASTPIEVRAIDGTSRDVSYGTLDDDLVLTPDASVKGYVSGGSPVDDIAAVTAADYTIVVNKTKTVEMLAAVDPAHLPLAIITIPHGVADQTYKIFIDGILVADYTAGNTNSPATWRTTEIAAALASDLTANLSPSLWDVSLDGSTIFIVNTAGEDFILKVEDSWGDQAMVGIKESARRFEDLPKTLPSSLAYDYDIVTVGAANDHNEYYIYVDGVAKAGMYSVYDATAAQMSLFLYNQLVVNLLSNPVFRCSKSGNYITIWRTDGVHSTITVSASNPQTLFVDSYDAISFANAVFAVKPDPTTQQGTYYVRWNTIANDGKTTSGNWEECPARGIPVAFDASTMPHRLVRMSDGNFVFAPIVWKDREVGDEISAPDPTFVGTEIQDTFFFKNRLGFLAKGSTILSRAGEYFDFFPTTATDVLDDDPIDAESSSKQVSVLRYGLPFQAQLILFSDQQQFSLGSGEKLLTPGTAAGDTLAAVAVDRCEPVSSGSNIYFASPSGEHTTIREMFVSPDTLTPDSADVSAHCPTYIPANIKKMAACEGKKTVFVLSYDDPASIYVYRYYWNGDEKIQSAWGKWTFSQEIVYMDVFDNFLIIAAEADGTLFLARVNLETKAVTVGLSYKVLLDQQEVLVGAFDTDHTNFIAQFPVLSTDKAFNQATKECVGISPYSTSTAAAFIPLGQTARRWLGMAAAPNGDVYAIVYAGDIYKQTAGVGNFVALGQTTRNWFSIAAAPNGNVYAGVGGVGGGAGDIYMQTAGAGNFIALGQTARFWSGMAAAPNGDVYACDRGGDIYKRTAGTGNFIALGQTSRNWRGMAAAPNGDVYAGGDASDIYKQTAGAGNFIALGQTVRDWFSMAAAPNGDVYAGVDFGGGGGSIYRQRAGIGDFIALDQESRCWYGVAVTPSGGVYAATDLGGTPPDGEIYWWEEASSLEGFSVPGNWSGDTVIFGRPYMFEHRFSEFGMKSADPKVYSRAGRGQLRTMNLSFEDTMSFDVVVSAVGRADTTQRFRATVPTTGEKRFTTLGDTRTTRVSIKSDSHLPCKFGGASYETMYAQRSR
jgi:uncharacterized Zn-binding protein involved in type VI secretion